jgi:hypothetical protein
MEIRLLQLYRMHTIAAGLSWYQVVEAERLANASPAGAHFAFSKQIDPNSPNAVNRWMLMAMHRGPLSVANPDDWCITIPSDPEPPPH